MADIFISYRRRGGDAGWARSLGTVLEDRFDTFFDTESMDYGETFPLRIEEAIKSCRLLFVLIGSEWSKPENLKRLWDEKDWVHREIKIAMLRHSVRVVPLTLDGTQLPLEEELPPQLRPLLSKLAYPLSHEKWKNDREDLIARVEGWLSNQAMLPPRNAVPPILPYLCNRVTQEDTLSEYIKRIPIGKSQRSLVCMLHGYKWEAHDGFIERLRYTRFLDKVFGAHDTGVAVCRLTWNLAKAKAGQYEELLTSAIKRDLIQDPMASDDDARRCLNTQTQPLILVMQVTWADFQACGQNFFSDLIQAWHSLFPAVGAPGDPPTILPSFPVVLWINFSYDHPSQELHKLDRVLILDKLEPVTDGDIQRWINTVAVKRWTAGHETKLLTLTEDESRWSEKGKMHMLRFVEAVHEILK